MGRDHHPQAFTMWMAGGGIKPGMTLGATDDLGFHIAEDPVHVHDLQATILHLLGLDHTKLTYHFQGRDFRLTDVAGEVVQEDPGVRAALPIIVVGDAEEELPAGFQQQGVAAGLQLRGQALVAGVPAGVELAAGVDALAVEPERPHVGAGVEEDAAARRPNRCVAKAR